MAGRGGKRGRAGARGGRRETRSNLNLQKNSSDEENEPQAKMAKKEAVDAELSELLTQPREILVQIINYLDPESLRELACSCKFLYSFCQTKGINVVFPIETAHLGIAGDHSIRCCFIGYKGIVGNQCLRELRKWPISIHINELHILPNYVTRSLWNEKKAEVKEHFVNSNMKKIRSVFMPCPKTAQEVVEFDRDFVQVFKIEELDVRKFVGDGQEMEAVEACLKLPLYHLRVQTFHEDLDADRLVNCSIPVLHMGAFITLEGMEKITQMWKTRNDLKNWNFRYRFAPNDFTDCFSRYDVRFFNYIGPIDSTSPPAFLGVKQYGDNKEISFFILRQDGKLICVSLSPEDEETDCIQFRMCPIDQGPLALRDL